MIIGEGEERPRLEKLIYKNNLEKRIFLLGYQINIYNYLINAKCYVSVSLWEGPDLAMLDAAFLNIPIICSDSPSGRKEFIDQNKRGYLFKTKDNNSFISIFEKFISEDSFILRKKIINSKKEVKNFTLLRYYLKIKEVLI